MLPSGETNALLGLTRSEGNVSTADDLFCEGQAGMQGAAVDPNFAENRRIYVYSTSCMTAPGTNRLMRLVVSDDFTSVGDRTDIVADDSPLEGFDQRIFTYGHRNIQGISFNPNTGAAVIAEHGPWHSDEITLLVNGGNGGWDPRPNVKGRGECPSNYCGYEPLQFEGMDRYERRAYMPMTDLVNYPDALQPMWDNNGWSQGTSSAVFLEGEQWGAWDGTMAVGLMGIGFGGIPIGQHIDIIEFNEEGTEVVDVTEMTLPMESGRFRSVVQGPEGALYVLEDAGMIHKLMP